MYEFFEVLKKFFKDKLNAIAFVAVLIFIICIMIPYDAAWFVKTSMMFFRDEVSKRISVRLR